MYAVFGSCSWPHTARWVLAAAVAGGCGLAVHACTRTEVVVVEPGAVAVDPGTWTTEVGATEAFSADVVDGEGRPIQGAPVVWSSSAPSVVEVTPDGRAEARTPGSAEVRATALGVTGAAAVTVEPERSLDLDPVAVSLVARTGAEPAAPAEVAVTNGGSGELSGLAATVSYAAGQPDGWLAVGLSSTNTPATLTVEGRTSSLPEGHYEASVTVTSPEVPGGPVELPVEVSITEDEPVLNLVPGAVGFAAVAGGTPPPPRTVQILNAGGGTMDGLSISIDWVDGPPGWLGASLSGEEAPATLTLVPDAGDLGSGSWRANVKVSAREAVNNPHTLPVTFSVEPLADLSVVQAGPTQVVEGEQVDFALTVANLGPLEALDVQLVDSLPTGLEFVSASDGGVPSGRQITWDVGDVPAGASVETSVRAAASEVGGWTNVARVGSSTRDPAEANDRAVLGFEVTPRPADLSVQKEGPETAHPGDVVTYVITTVNTGPGEAAGVVVVDSLPDEVTVLSTSGGGTRSGRAVTWNVGALPPGATRVHRVEVRVDGPGELRDVAGVSSATPDPTLSNNRSAVTTEVKNPADLSVVKSGPERVSILLQTIEYEVAVTNAGPGEALDVQVVDSLPDNVDFVEASGDAVVQGGTVTWTYGALAPGETIMETLEVRPQSLGTVTNVVRASSATPDPDDDDLRSMVETEVGLLQEGTGDRFTKIEVGG